MDDTKKKIVELLAEAHSNEMALISTLEAHIAIAERGSYKTLLQDHLKETRRHGNRVGRRLEELGYSQSIFALSYATFQNVAKQALVLTKGPIDALRGGRNVKEKMLRNAMDEVMTEGMEIGAYDAIESVARGLGDTETADLAAEIRVDEEAMLNALRKEIPILADLVLNDLPAGPRNIEEPWPGYDDMTVDEIQGRLDDASGSLLLAVRNYELRNKNRSTVLKATETETASA